MATETAEHASGSGFPPFDQIMDTGVSQVFWLIVTFSVLYFAVANVFLPKIRKAVEDRDGAIKRDVAEAAVLSGKADESVKQFEAQIAAARANARDTASKAKAEADARTAAATAPPARAGPRLRPTSRRPDCVVSSVVRPGHLRSQRWGQRSVDAMPPGPPRRPGHKSAPRGEPCIDN